MQKKWIALLCAALLLLCTLPAQAASSNLSNSQKAKFEAMATVIGDILCDGAGAGYTKFDASDEAEDDFYHMTMYYYLKEYENKKSDFGGYAVKPKKDRDGIYSLLTLLQCKRIIASFYGGEYVRNTIDALSGTDKTGPFYHFSMGDGPSCKAKLESYSIDSNDNVNARIKLQLSVENKEWQIGTLDIRFEKKKASMFGYYIDSYTLIDGDSK